MVAIRRAKAIALGGVLIMAGAGAIPASMGFAAETPGPVPLLSYDVPAPVIADPMVAAEVQESQDDISSDSAAFASADDAQAKPGSDPVQLECLAKAVHREAGNQSHDGKLAVAQLVVNRVKSGRFADSICGVVNQRGQFFQTSAYNPRRDTAQWASAMEVARAALDGSAPEVIPGAVFFHATYVAPNSWFRSRQRVATLGQHIFYR
jgi:spore germination cell wall hydrolase CwlJ-like protein